MNEIHGWIARQTAREQSVIRLEDALIGGRFARYFAYRLRFFVARTGISTAVHALKIVLLLGAFPRTEFLVIIVLQGIVALTVDFWWGALEQMRGQIRSLQRRSARQLIPAEIGRWLTLSSRVSLAGLAAAGGFAAYRALTGGLGAADAFIVALLIGAALDLTARTYHSGAYALRRVYRPLPSLLALDVASVGVLLAFWPLIGIWAFPLAELISVVTVVSISIYYTSRTYRTLAVPTLLPLLRLRRPVPSLAHLRAATAPAIGYALVGLEALVVIAGVATATTSAGTSLVVLLAALAPVNRASFEWARLLYFDLKRLELPVLADLRRHFDRAVVKLAVVIGGVTWAVASAVAVGVLVGWTPLLILALLLLFSVRSLLAAAQMTAFTRSAYARLTCAGLVGVLGVVFVFGITAQAEERLIGVSGALLISLLLLAILPAGPDPAEPVLSLPDWLRRLRAAPGPVIVTRLSFDDRFNVRGTTVEARRAEERRRATIARRIGSDLGRRRGAAARPGALELWWFEPLDARLGRGRRLLGASAGLLDRRPLVEHYPDAALAARALAEDALATDLPAAPGAPAVEQLMSDFARRFPAGMAHDVTGRAPSALARLPSQLRVEIQRAALVFARDLRPARGPDGWEVTALVWEGSLRAIFVVPRRSPASARRAWRELVRAWVVRVAAGTPVVTTGISRTASAAAGVAAQEAPML